VNGNLMYEMAKQRIAEQHRAAREAAQARSQRAAARGRHSKAEARDAVPVPVIPDFADEMFGTAPNAVPAPRAEQDETGRGRPARSGR
jgi:hypothetical protein